MNAVDTELAERMRGETQDLDRTVERALAAWAQAKRRSYEDAYLDSVALNLHGFYSGVKRLFELIVKRVDRPLPTGKGAGGRAITQLQQRADLFDRLARPGLRAGRNPADVVE